MHGLLTNRMSCSGIFVGGVSPLWLIAHRGTLVPHPCEAQGPVVGFTPFNNPSCPHVRPMACAHHASNSSMIGAGLHLSPHGVAVSGRDRLFNCEPGAVAVGPDTT